MHFEPQGHFCPKLSSPEDSVSDPEETSLARLRNCPHCRTYAAHPSPTSLWLEFASAVALMSD